MTEWPSWRYGPDGQAQIFNNADEVPAGWSDHPSSVGAAVKADPFDHDGDGKPGGSKPGRRSARSKKS